jgi:hypothetical protein
MKIDLIDVRVTTAILAAIMRTTIALLAAGLAVSAAPVCQADIVLGAPGVPAASQMASQVPFSKTVVLSNSYKFVFSGIEAKGNTLGAPGNSGTNGNGGQFHVSATVSDNSNQPKTKVGNLTFVNVQEFNSAPVLKQMISPAAVYRATNSPITITLLWKGEGNAHKPDGTFNILGEHQPAPPVPTGSLNFAVGDWMLQTEGGTQTPEGIVKIVRE